MRILTGLIAFTLLVSGCGNADTQPARTASPDFSKDPVYQEGLSLVAKHKCMQCHAVGRTLTGPAYQDVARKYRQGPDTIVAHLAHKIIAGGKGVWGDIPMIPHAAVTQAEAETMVKYILKLAD